MSVCNLLYSNSKRIGRLVAPLRCVWPQSFCDPQQLESLISKSWRAVQKIASGLPKSAHGININNQNLHLDSGRAMALGVGSQMCIDGHQF